MFLELWERLLRNPSETPVKDESGVQHQLGGAHRAAVVAPEPNQERGLQKNPAPRSRHVHSNVHVREAIPSSQRFNYSGCIKSLSPWPSQPAHLMVNANEYYIFTMKPRARARVLVRGRINAESLRGGEGDARTDE